MLSLDGIFAKQLVTYWRGHLRCWLSTDPETTPQSPGESHTACHPVSHGTQSLLQLCRLHQDWHGSPRWQVSHAVL